MIRINLLPNAKRRETQAPGGGSVRALTVLGVILGVALIVGLFFHHSSRQRELDLVRSENSTISSETDSIQSRVGDHNQVIEEMDEIRAKESAIEELKAARTGPTSMFIELSHVLSPGGRPAIDPLLVEHIEHGQMYNRDWDTHHVWLSNLTEDRREVTIEGSGRLPDDVGEFMQRLKLSRYFESISLDEIRDHLDEVTKVTVQRFKITAKVKY